MLSLKSTKLPKYQATKNRTIWKDFASRAVRGLFASQRSAFYRPATFENAEFAEFARKTQTTLTAARGSGHVDNGHLSASFYSFLRALSVISVFSAFYRPATFENVEFAEFARKTQITLTTRGSSHVG